MSVSKALELYLGRRTPCKDNLRCPKISLPRVSYSLIQSSTVIRSRESMILMSLGFVSYAFGIVIGSCQILPSSTCSRNVCEVVTGQEQRRVVFRGTDFSGWRVEGLLIVHLYIVLSWSCRFIIVRCKARFDCFFFSYLIHKSL